jgi:DNA-binding NtrC family response regulator
VTILLVEDESGVREMTARVLSHAGYTVIAAARAREAVENLRQATVGDRSAADRCRDARHARHDAGRPAARQAAGTAGRVHVGYIDAMPATTVWTEYVAFVPKPFAAARSGRHGRAAARHRITAVRRSEEPPARPPVYLQKPCLEAL